MHGNATRESPASEPTSHALDACGVPLIRTSEGFWSAGSREVLSYPESGADSMLSVEDTSFWFNHRSEVIRAMVQRFPPDGPIWDVGGGNGFQAWRLRKDGVDAVLVEPGVHGCRNAVARGVETVVCATLQSLQLKDQSIAAVSLFDVAEHLPDPRGMLAECRRVLRPNGRIYITVPAYAALWSDEDEYAQHQCRYSRALLQSQLQDAGFRIETLTNFFRPLVLPILLLRALPYRVRRMFGASPQGADLSDHGGGGLAQRTLEGLLERELGSIERGHPQSIGSSIFAVAIRS